jgi:hypothetical protein
MMLQQVVFCALQGGSGLKLGAARRVPPPPATQSGLCKRAALRRHLELLQLQGRVLRLADAPAAAATATEATQQHSAAIGLQADVEDDSSRCGVMTADAVSTGPIGDCRPAPLWPSAASHGSSPLSCATRASSQLLTMHRCGAGLGMKHGAGEAACRFSYAAHKAVAGHPSGGYVSAWRRLREQLGGAFEHWIDKPAALEQFCVGSCDGGQCCNDGDWVANQHEGA